MSQKHSRRGFLKGLGALLGVGAAAKALPQEKPQGRDPELVEIYRKSLPAKNVRHLDPLTVDEVTAALGIGVAAKATSPATSPTGQAPQLSEDPTDKARQWNPETDRQGSPPRFEIYSIMDVAPELKAGILRCQKDGNYGPLSLCTPNPGEEDFPATEYPYRFWFKGERKPRHITREGCRGLTERHVRATILNIGGQFSRIANASWNPPKPPNAAQGPYDWTLPLHGDSPLIPGDSDSIYLWNGQDYTRLG